MAKYTQVAVSGYNSSPPADDGSQVASNQVKYSKIKTNLSDPLNSFASSIDTNILAAFAKTFLARSATKSITFSVANTEDGYSYVCTNSITANLPAVSTVYAGFAVLIHNFGVGTITIDGSGAETVGGSATQSLTSGWAVVQCDGSNWNYFAANNVTAFTAAATHTFSGAQIASATALTSASSHIALDLVLNNNFTHTFTENTTLDNASNIAANQSGRIYFTQHASSPKTLAFGNKYKFPNGTVPSVTATNSAIDVLYYDVLDSSNILCNLIKGVA